MRIDLRVAGLAAAATLVAGCYDGLDSSSALTTCLEARSCMLSECTPLADALDAAPTGSSEAETARADYDACVNACGGLRTSSSCLDGSCDGRRHAFATFEGCRGDPDSTECNQLETMCFELSRSANTGYGIPPHCENGIDEPDDQLCEWLPYERACGDFYELIIPVCSPQQGNGLQECIVDQFGTAQCAGLDPDDASFGAAACELDLALASLAAYACTDPTNARLQPLVVTLEEAGIPIPSVECDDVRQQCLDD
jgi:hypothetical protein